MKVIESCKGYLRITCRWWKVFCCLVICAVVSLEVIFHLSRPWNGVTGSRIFLQTFECLSLLSELDLFFLIIIYFCVCLAMN